MLIFNRLCRAWFNNVFGYLELDRGIERPGSGQEDITAPKQSTNEKETCLPLLFLFEFHKPELCLVPFSTQTLF